jgi:hypothetical protein
MKNRSHKSCALELNPNNINYKNIHKEKKHLPGFTATLGPTVLSLASRTRIKPQPAGLGETPLATIRKWNMLLRTGPRTSQGHSISL